MTELLPSTREGIARAARILAGGGLVAMPTETVYGLAGDARNDRAVARIYEAKGRPSFNPLIVHLDSIAAVHGIADLPDAALRLADAFWPGPLTLVLPLRLDAGLSPLVTAGLPTVAIRLPAHPVARALISASGGPVAAPSANPSGRISPTRPEHVLDGLSGRIEAVIDAGPCAVGVESTIIGFDPVPTLLRSGGQPAETIEACIGQPLALAGVGRITAPGQLVSHYAPEAAIRLAAHKGEPGEVMIGFGAVAGDMNLSPSGDLVEAAANLFHMLHAADRLARERGASRIAVAEVPETGLGRAINDRLRRAGAPRD